jgi:hypothetical protein
MPRPKIAIPSEYCNGISESWRHYHIFLVGIPVHTHPYHETQKRNVEFFLQWNGVYIKPGKKTMHQILYSEVMLLESHVIQLISIINNLIHL